MARVEEGGRRGRGKSCPGLPPKKRILPVCHFAVHMLAKIFMKAAKPAARPKQQLTKVRTPTCSDAMCFNARISHNLDVRGAACKWPAGNRPFARACEARGEAQRRRGVAAGAAGSGLCVCW